MVTLEEEEAIHWGMLPTRIYLSRAFPQHGEELGGRGMRYATKVIDSEGFDAFEAMCDELVIRETSGQRQQIKAVFFEDDRSVQRLIFQRYTGAVPSSKQVFSFRGEEIDKIRWLLEVVRKAELGQTEKLRFSDQSLREMITDEADLVRFLRVHRESIGQAENVGELAQYMEFCERQRQVKVFESLLFDEDYFREMGTKWGKIRDEDIWQHFFERNPWIFGLTLAPVFLSSLDGKKLEQVVRGYSVAAEGKRADAFMRTNGVLSSLCFVEIKTHKTRLLHHDTYRSGSWSTSRDVAGAIAQCHATIQAAMKELQTRLAMHDSDGNPTGEEFFLYQPRSYLVVGCLQEFMTQHGPSETKFRSFELYRRNLRSPEIVTYDELLERARAAVVGSGTLQR